MCILRLTNLAVLLLFVNDFVSQVGGVERVCVYGNQEKNFFFILGIQR